MAIPAPPPPSGYQNFGAGNGPQGLSSSPGMPGGPPSGVRATPGQQIGVTVNQGFYVILTAANKPQRAPAMTVPPGCVVLVRAHNGQVAGNQGIVFLSASPELCSTGDPITPDSEITWPSDNTINLWVQGTNIGDGIRVAIQRQR